MSTVNVSNEAQFVPKINPMDSTQPDSVNPTTFINNSTTIGMEPLGELDGAINNLAMNAKYNLTQLSYKQLLVDRWSKLQSWGSFIDTSRMMLPISIQQWSKRLVKNFKYFQSNYLFVFLILCIYCILTSPLLLLVLAAILAVGYILTLKNAERPVKILGRKMNLGQQYLALGLLSLPLLHMVGAGGAIFWVIGASLFVITLHASVYSIENEQQPQQLMAPFTFEVQSI